jgi:hypothetical protein
MEGNRFCVLVILGILDPTTGNFQSYGTPISGAVET